MNHAKAPGQPIRDALAHVARGADTIGLFQWRQSRAGSEKFHSAVVPHAGPDSARFREVDALGRIADRLGELVGSRVEAHVAILLDYQAMWACRGAVHAELRARRPRGGPGRSPVAPRPRGHGRRRAPGCRPHGIRRRRRAHALPRLRRARCRRRRCGRGRRPGVVTYFSGISDEHDHVRLGGYPGAFRDLLGVRVEEFFPLGPDETVALADGTGTWWSEDVTALPGTEVVSTYAVGPLAGRPAVTRRDVGGGAAWYLSTLPDDDRLGALLDGVVSEAGVARPPCGPAARCEASVAATATARGCSCSTTPTSTARSLRPGTTWSPVSTWARPCGSHRTRAAVVREG